MSYKPCLYSWERTSETWSRLVAPVRTKLLNLHRKARPRAALGVGQSPSSAPSGGRSRPEPRRLSAYPESRTEPLPQASLPPPRICHHCTTLPAAPSHRPRPTNPGPWKNCRHPVACLSHRPQPTISGSWENCRHQVECLSSTTPERGTRVVPSLLLNSGPTCRSKWATRRLHPMELRCREPLAPFTPLEARSLMALRVALFKSHPADLSRAPWSARRCLPSKEAIRG